MLISIIGLLKNDNFDTVGYRLIDTDDNNKIKDVTKYQLITVLKQKKISVLNAELVNGKTLRGKYYPLHSLPEIGRDYIESAKYVILATVNNTRAVISNCLGDVKIFDAAALRTNSLQIINDTDRAPKLTIKEKNVTQNKKSKLDFEVMYPEVVWHFEQFDSYMRQHNYEYTILGYKYNNSKHEKEEIVNVNNYKEYKNLTLTHIDEECKIVHLPVELQYIDGMYINNREIVSLIIPSDIDEIRTLVTNNDDEDQQFYIRKLYIQKGHPEAGHDYPGLKNLNILTPDLHIGNGIIQNAFNNCSIACIKFDWPVYQLNKCFNKCKFINTQGLDLSPIERIKNSFTDMTGVSGIGIGTNTSNIARSFNGSEIKYVAFKENTKLRDITSSFMDCDLSSVNLTNLKELLTLSYESFKGNKNLKDVVLNESLNVIGSYAFADCAIESIKLPEIASINYHAFDNCPIKEMVFPEDINSVSYPLASKDTVFRYTGHDKTLNSQLIVSYGKETKIDFGNTFTTLGSQAFYTSEEGVYIPDSIETLSIGSFTGAHFKVYDTMSTPKVSTIGYAVFQGEVNIDTLVINDNITCIESHAFYKMSGIGKIVISGKACGFENTAFSKMNLKSIPPTFYVVSSNEYAKKFLKSKKISFKEINNINEVISKDKESNDEAAATYSLIYGGEQQYQELFNKPYVDNIEILMKVAQRINRLSSVSYNKNTLDTSKFIELNLSTYSKVYENVNRLCKTMAERQQDRNEPTDILTDQFIGTANLITKIFNNVKECYTKEFVDIASTVGNMDTTNFICTCGSGAIVITKTRPFTYTDLYLLFIVIQDKIMFQTPMFYGSSIYGQQVYRNSIYSITYIDQLYNCGNMDLAHGFGIADLLEETDTIYTKNEDGNSFAGSNTKVTFHGAEMPKSFLNGVITLLKYSQLIFIGFEIKQDNRSIRKPQKALFYDLVQQKFLEMHGYYDFFNDRQMCNVQNVSILHIYDLSEFDDINKVYFEEFRKYSLNPSVGNIIRLMSSSKQDIDDMFKDPSQYHTEGDEEICLLADYMYQHGIKTRNNLDATITPWLLQSEFFSEYNGSINKCNKREYKCNASVLDAEDTLISYDDNTFGGCEIVGIINSKTSLTKTGTLKICMIKLNRLISILYNIGETRANNTNDKMPLCKIVNTPVDMNDYIVVDTLVDYAFENTGMKWLLSLDKLNGDTYIIGEVFDTDFYTLFRFKDIKLGYNFLQSLTSAYQYQLQQLIYTRFKGVNTGLSNFDELREAIVSGYPDRYPYIGTYVKLFNALAKQRAE